MTSLWKKIDKQIKKYPGKTMDFYNNLISSILGGTIIALSIDYFLIPGKKNWLIYPIILGCFYILGLLIIGKINKNTKINKKKQVRNYRLNILASIIGAFYVSIIVLIPNLLIRIVSTLLLIIISIAIIYIIIARGKK